MSGDGLVQHERARALHGEWIAWASRSAAEAACASAATCLTASPRSQQELRLKPITLRTQNQRGQLARVQIVVVDRRTPDALRKERPAAPTDLSIRSATRCQQGLSQLRVKGSVINNGALRRHGQHPLFRRPALVAAAACSLTRSVCTSAVDCQQPRLTVDTQACMSGDVADVDQPRQRP